MVSEKVSVSVSKIVGIEKSIGIGFKKNVWINVSVSVSKKFGIRAFCFWLLSIYFGPKVLNMAEKL